MSSSAIYSSALETEMLLAPQLFQFKSFLTYAPHPNECYNSCVWLMQHVPDFPNPFIDINEMLWHLFLAHYFWRNFLWYLLPMFYAPVSLCSFLQFRHIIQASFQVVLQISSIDTLMYCKVVSLQWLRNIYTAKKALHPNPTITAIQQANAHFWHYVLRNLLITDFSTSSAHPLRAYSANLLILILKNVVHVFNMATYHQQ